MEDRRTFLTLAAAAVVPIGPQTPATAPPAAGDQPLGVIARQPLSGVLGGYEIVLSRSVMRFFPGASTPVHRHPGVVLAYVLEGRVRFAINNEPEQVIPTGGTFFEPLGAVHTTSGSASADEATRILVFEVRPQEPI
jgi:quercetin dioxygenase-like cupin family protein